MAALSPSLSVAYGASLAAALLCVSGVAELYVDDIALDVFLSGR